MSVYVVVGMNVTMVYLTVNERWKCFEKERVFEMIVSPPLTSTASEKQTSLLQVKRMVDGNRMLTLCFS